MDKGRLFLLHIFCNNWPYSSSCFWSISRGIYFKCQRDVIWRRLLAPLLYLLFDYLALFLEHVWRFQNSSKVMPRANLYIPSTLNIDIILWHTQLNVCAENVKSWFKSWFFPFTFQAYILPHTLNCMCVSLFKFHIWILEHF